METQGHGIDKRLSRIDRWLKRCMAACRCGSWNSALMEIECMEAEARECREALWGIAEDEARGRVRRPLRASLSLGARAAALALVLVMALDLPLSVDQDRPFGGFGGLASSGRSVALVTSTESDILEALRASLSDRNEGRVVLTLDRPEEETARLPRGAAAAEEKPAPGAARVQPLGRLAGLARPGRDEAGSADLKSPPPAAALSARPAKEPSMEEVISLIQVGQRALRISEPVVRVERP